MTIQTQNKESETSKLSEIFSKYSAYFQASPLVIVLFLFALVPVAIILMYSVFVFDGFVTRPGFTFTNYFEFFSEWSSLLNLWHTARIFIITWVITLVLGFIISYFLVFDLISFRVKVFFFLLTVVPFWTSGVVRMTSWIPFLGSKGILNSFLINIGLVDEPVQFLLFSEFAVIVSYVHMFTLFMVAPLFNVMARINPSLIEAAKDQGATGFQILRFIIIPMSKPGIIIGTIFIVALVATDFTAIRILSGAQSGSLANSVSVAFFNGFYPIAAAQSVILLALLLLFVGGLMRVVDIRKQM